MAAAKGLSEADRMNDAQVLDRALLFEHRAMWTYDVAATKTTGSEVGRAVHELGLQNRADHERHGALLVDAILILGGTPVRMDTNYDLSSFIRRGEGDLDGDVNIAKLALALEVDAAVGYVSDTMKLKSPEMIELAASMACVEAGHAARFRAALGNLGLAIPVIPSAVMRTSSRNKWIIKT